MSHFVFEESAIAFLDVLGFKNLIADAEKSPSAFQSLVGLRTVLDAHVKWDNVGLAPSVPDEIKPRYIFISDSIILSAPLQHRNYDGLEIVVLKTIEIAQKLLEQGYLLRGGIAVGKVWTDNQNIFGTGYINAYVTETRAIHPQVLLSPDAAKHWRTSALPTNTMCLDSSDSLIVDTLHPAYIRGAQQTHGRVEDAYSQYRAHIHSNLERSPIRLNGPNS